MEEIDDYDIGSAHASSEGLHPEAMDVKSYQVKEDAYKFSPCKETKGKHSKKMKSRPGSVPANAQKKKNNHSSFDKYAGVFLGKPGEFRSSHVYKKLNREAPMFESPMGLRHQTKHAGHTIGYCDREPFEFVCKNGPGCSNHDWAWQSPLHVMKQKRNHLCRSPGVKKHASMRTYELVQTQPKVIARHDWTDITKCPAKIVCKRGPGCPVHDWWHRSPLKVVCNDGPLCTKHDWAKYGIKGTCDDETTFNMQNFAPPDRDFHIHWMGCNGGLCNIEHQTPKPKKVIKRKPKPSLRPGPTPGPTPDPKPIVDVVVKDEGCGCCCHKPKCCKEAREVQTMQLRTMTNMSTNSQNLMVSNFAKEGLKSSITNSYCYP